MMIKKSFPLVVAYILLVFPCFNILHAQPNASQQGPYNLNAANIPYQTGLVRIPRFSEAEFVKTLDGMTTVHYQAKSTFTVGSPYLYDDFLPGTMKLKEGVILEDFPMRYNIESGIMEFVYHSDTLDIIDPFSLSSIHFAEKDFIYHVSMEGENRVSGSYFEVLYENDGVKLLLKRTARLERDEYLNNYAGGFGSGDLYYENDEFYYMITDDGSAIPVRTKKDIVGLYPELKKDIKAFWKQEGLKFKNEEDLILVSGYIADLI